MKYTILFPCNYFDVNAVEPSFQNEFDVAKTVGFDVVLFNHDEFVRSGKLIVTGYSDRMPKYAVLRGWMLKASEYADLYNRLINKYGLLLVNTPNQYITLHHHNLAFQQYFVDEPVMVFEHPESARMEDIRHVFDTAFVMKDNVKSVKEHDFPLAIRTDISDEQFQNLVSVFIKLRGSLYTGEIVLKQYKKLKLPLNEYRVFYFGNKIMTFNKNSNQPEDSSVIPLDIMEKARLMDSYFYTVDFAELESDNKWTVIETGDGQVSGLSPNQNILEFYSKF